MSTPPASTAGDAPPARRHWIKGAVRMAVGPRTLREGVHLLLNFPLAVTALVFAISAVAISGSLVITFVGVPLLCLTLVALRGYGFVERARARGLLGLSVAEPGPLRPAGERPGLLAWMGGVLRSGQCWRSLAYVLVHFPWAVFTFCVVVVVWSLGVSAATYPLWFWGLSEGGRPGVNVDGQGNGWVWDSPIDLVLASAAGLLLLFAGGWVIRGLTVVDRMLVSGLLGPSLTEHRMQQLETGRSVVVDTSAADLRRIERDLHDGAQARLVALAMDLGLAKEKLTEDPEAAARMVDEAHGEVKLALQELRDLARGIHPAILTDRGLGPALSSVASRCTVPVTVDVDLPLRPDGPIEGIAYFTTSELLQNVSKHSRARSAILDVWRADDRLMIQLTDDGVGGARVDAGSGLAGLAERLAAVDGVLSVSSPDGGPTTVTAALPWRVRGGA